MITPVEAFLLVISGSLGVYWECISPGRFVPGLLGAALACTGMYGLMRNEMNAPGVVLIGVAAALFVFEALWRVHLVAGTAATVALSVGFSILTTGPAHIPAALAAPTCGLFGAVTVYLCYSSKVARRNKWSDLAE